MRVSLVLVLVLAIGFVGFLRGQLPAENSTDTAIDLSSQNNAPAGSSSHPLAVTRDLDTYLSVQAPAEKAMPAVERVDSAFGVHAGHDHSSHSADGNPAADLSSFPVSMQVQIVRLSNRAETSIEPVEVQPGVFKIPKGFSPRVVPVAVMNDDGTVSTYEY